ncbi:24985_t:CDS:2, partial [Racocetra persica]
MSDASSYINHAANVTNSTLGVVKVFSSSAAVVADAIVPFVPLITEISSIVNEIITLYQTAEHNKRICGSLLSRATAAQTAVTNLEIRRLENEDLFKSKEYYKNFQKLVNVISKIKIFIEEVSQLKGLRRFLASKSIEDEFKYLTDEFDGLMRLLNFTMAYLREIEGGITNITDNITQINSKLDDITQLNLAWQKKLLNNDESIFESALIKMTDLYDPPNPVKRGKVSKKSLTYEDVAVKEKFLESNDQDLINDILSQVVILKKLKESQHILQFFGIIQDDILEIRNLVLVQKIRPSFSIGVPTEYSKISYQSMQDSPNARPALKNVFMTLYSLYQTFQPKSSPRPVTPRMLTDEDLPDMDPNELSLDDLTFDVLSMKEAIAEHRKRNGDKLKVWEAFKVHAEDFGDITARYWVGYYLYYRLCPIDEPDNEVKKNERLVKAAALFKEAADTGLADAQLRYGHCLWSGEGVQKNIREAIEYFQKSADNGNTTALYNIGNLYYNGSGVPQDKELGIIYLRKAALQGQPKALEMCKRKEIGL